MPLSDSEDDAYFSAKEEAPGSRRSSNGSGVSSRENFRAVVLKGRANYPYGTSSSLGNTPDSGDVAAPSASGGAAYFMRDETWDRVQPPREAAIASVWANELQGVEWINVKRLLDRASKLWSEIPLDPIVCRVASDKRTLLCLVQACQALADACEKACEVCQATNPRLEERFKDKMEKQRKGAQYFKMRAEAVF